MRVPGLSNLLLHQTAAALVLQPVGVDAGEKCLVIDRDSAKITLEAWSAEKFASPSPRKVFGLIGLPRLLLSSHLVVVTAREQARPAVQVTDLAALRRYFRQHIPVGKLRGAPIWRVSAAEVVSLRSSLAEASPEGAAAERHYADLLSSGVKEAQLFFCLQEDITQTSQAASDAAASSLSAASGTPARSTAAAASAAGHGCGEPRFLWNGHIAAPLWEAGAGRFTLPLVCGFVGCVAINGGRAAGSEFTLIARTDCSRVGPRLWARGVSADGSVANWVETEQIVRTPNAEASFLQVRGSVPVPWSQPPCLLPKPPIAIAPDEECRGPCLRHLERLAEKHGAVCLVNLLRQVGREGRLGDAYAAAAAAAGAATPPTAEGDDCDDASAGNTHAHEGRGTNASGSGKEDPQAQRRRGKPCGGAAGPDGGGARGGGGRLGGRLFFTAFDYTAECPAGKQYKLAKLFSQLEPFLEESGFFLRLGPSPADPSTSAPAPDGAAPPFGSPLKSPLRGAAAGPAVPGTPARRPGAEDGPVRTQSGVVRTNCLDCLDRTNLVQTLLGERLLALQLSAMGVLPKRTASLADAPEAQEALRALWKAQGDAISRGYTGTAALRKKRWLRDAAISLGRYVRNNHADGRRADAAAVISGAHVPRRGAPSPFPSGLVADVTARVRRLPSMQVAILLCGARCLQAARAALSFGAPLGSPAGAAASAVAALFWGCLVAVLHRVALLFGALFVDRPHLLQATGGKK